MVYPIVAHPEINDSLFDKIIGECTCDTNNDFDTVGFSGNYYGYYINFYGCQQEDYTLLVECFGKVTSGDFKNYETTTKQLSKMQQILHNKAEQLENETRGEMQYHSEVIEIESTFGRPDTIFNSTW